MRSRDGNRNFPLAIYSLILFNFSNLFADEYLISYRYMVKDAMLYNENMAISKAMRKCSGKVGEPVLLDSKKSDTLKEIINKNSEIFMNFIHQLGLHVEHKEATINLQNHSTTILTLKTTCFKVDFNDNFARIAPLK